MSQVKPTRPRTKSPLGHGSRGLRRTPPSSPPYPAGGRTTLPMVPQGRLAALLAGPAGRGGVARARWPAAAAAARSARPNGGAEVRGAGRHGQRGGAAAGLGGAHHEGRLGLLREVREQRRRWGVLGGEGEHAWSPLPTRLFAPGQRPWSRRRCPLSAGWGGSRHFPPCTTGASCRRRAVGAGFGGGTGLRGSRFPRGGALPAPGSAERGLGWALPATASPRRAPRVVRGRGGRAGGAGRERAGPPRLPRVGAMLGRLRARRGGGSGLSASCCWGGTVHGSAGRVFIRMGGRARRYSIVVSLVFLLVGVEKKQVPWKLEVINALPQLFGILQL